MAAEVPEKKKSKFTFPTAYTILALLLVVVALLTFVIPAGKYDTDPTDGAPIPGTYHPVEASPQRLRDAILAPINGMYGIKDVEGNVNVYNDGALYGAIDVALFILMIGGFLGVTMKTGAIDAGIACVVKRLGGERQAAHSDFDDHLCGGRHVLRHGRGIAGVLSADHRGADRAGL